MIQNMLSNSGINRMENAYALILANAKKPRYFRGKFMRHSSIRWKHMHWYNIDVATYHMIRCTGFFTTSDGYFKAKSIYKNRYRDHTKNPEYSMGVN
jgi:hypothetical protein